MNSLYIVSLILIMLVVISIFINRSKDHFSNDYSSLIRKKQIINSILSFKLNRENEHPYSNTMAYVYRSLQKLIVKPNSRNLEKEIDNQILFLSNLYNIIRLEQEFPAI